MALSQGNSSVVLSGDSAPWGEFFTTADGNTVALHALSYSLVTAERPAMPGEWIVLYASNLGPVLGPPATGVPAPLDRLISLDPLTSLDPLQTFPWAFKAWLRTPAGDQLLTTNFFGLAPGFVGVYQVNAKLPDSLPAGVVQIYLQRSRDCGFFFTPGCGRGIVMDTSVTATVP